MGASYHLWHAQIVAGVHLLLEVAQQFDSVTQSPSAVHHREEHDRHTLYCRLPHLHQTPRPRKDALGCKDEEHISLVDALIEKRAKINLGLGLGLESGIGLWLQLGVGFTG